MPGHFQPDNKRGGCRRFLAGLGDLLLPQDCQLCGAFAGNPLLCGACFKDLPHIATGTACPRCAIPAPGGQTCGTCLRSPPHFDATFARLQYAYPANRLIQDLKYHARIPVARLLAGMMMEISVTSMSITEQSEPSRLLVPMPLHAARLRTRGFNQAMEIARCIARSLPFELVGRGIERLRDTPSQSGLPLARRRANLRGAFACGLDLRGRSVIVIDDVMTTGASLNELARVLKRAGATRVENWVAARTWTNDPAHV